MMILLFTEKHEICQNTINVGENYIEWHDWWHETVCAYGSNISGKWKVQFISYLSEVTLDWR